MKLFLYTALFLLAAGAAQAGSHDTEPTPAPDASLRVTAEGIGTDGVIQPQFAYCIPAAQGHMQPGEDKSVGLSWSKGPAGTKSYAVIVVDPDVPAIFTDANQEGKTIAASAPRRDFYHWVLFDIPAATLAIPAYADSPGATPGGKYVLATPYGMRGINDYAAYFASDPVRKGVYAGYDGPCPPWNDERVHHYHFKVFALDVPSLNLQGPVTGAQALAALNSHILAQGEIVGTYTLNPARMK